MDWLRRFRKPRAMPASAYAALESADELIRFIRTNTKSNPQNVAIVALPSHQQALARLFDDVHAKVTKALSEIDS